MTARQTEGAGTCLLIDGHGRERGSSLHVDSRRDLGTIRFIDLFAGLGGFHRAVKQAFPDARCVFACELDPVLRANYTTNFPDSAEVIHGDLRESRHFIPRHDLLCAGFPCQPFSKSGAQLGMEDETRGTLFHEILAILETHRPTYVVLENVGNFGRHDAGRTWTIVRERLQSLGYDVQGTEHKTPRPLHDWRDRSAGRGRPRERSLLSENPHTGTGLLSPHHFGIPHHRERFFIVAVRGKLPEPAFPVGDRRHLTSLEGVALANSSLTAEERRQTRLTSQQKTCIGLWNELLAALPQANDLPSFPIWADELDAKYPFEGVTPWSMPARTLAEHVPEKSQSHAALLAQLPSYARERTGRFRDWKIAYIRRNREWWAAVRPHLPARWSERIGALPPSLRKLEWNVKDGERDLWCHVLQFRPSGLRAKRYTSIPALVAMTATQIPILGPKRRFLSRTEGLRLQGFPDHFKLPDSRDRAFKALGNAVNVDLVQRIVHQVVTWARVRHSESREHTPTS